MGVVPQPLRTVRTAHVLRGVVVDLRSGGNFAQPCHVGDGNFKTARVFGSASSGNFFTLFHHELQAKFRRRLGATPLFF